jgi:DNA-binding transcriptional ArsR family regulator
MTLYYMVKRYTDSLDLIFFALADPTRRAVLARLAEGDAAVSELAAPLAMTLAAATKHLVLLENASLIAREKVGRTVTCRLTAKPLEEAASWMTTYAKFWDEQFAALAAHLARKDMQLEEKPCPPSNSKRFVAPRTSRHRAKRYSKRGRTPKN